MGELIMFEEQLRFKPGVKHKKNPIYEMENIEIIKKEDIPRGIQPRNYSELVDDNFVGKLAIAYEKDNVGQSGGNAQWCYIYDCNNGIVEYDGVAIHKCVDGDVPNHNYNEMIFSIWSKLIFSDNANIRTPRIVLVRNLDIPEDKPAVLSYNIVQREQTEEQDVEEVIIMKTAAFNVMERQDIHNNRLHLSAILDAVKIQVMKKVKLEKNKSKNKIKDAILGAKIAKQTGESNIEISDEQEELLNLILTKIDEINENTSLENFLEELSNSLGRKVSEEELRDIKVKGTSVIQLLREIKAIAIEKYQNYKELEKSIIQVTISDLMVNNIDRHLNNWILIRDKMTNRYVLGIFDHAASFINMSYNNVIFSFGQNSVQGKWENSSVLLDSQRDKKIGSSRGKDVLKYIFDNYREYAIEILQKMHDKIPEFERIISYETIPIAEYEKLSDEQSKQYYANNSEIIVSPKRIIDNLKGKFREIRHEFDISFDKDEARFDT